MMLEKYCDAAGVSGCEGDIRDIIFKDVESLGETKVDSIGNLIVHKTGKGTKVMLSSHMDGVGLIVIGIKDDGRIRFAPVGKIDSRILPAKRVVFVKNGLHGVIGCKPIHLQSEEEYRRSVDVKDMFIDIGPSSKDEVEEHVRVGDYAAFDSRYVDIGDYIKSPSLDGRAGCAMLTELLSMDFNIDLYGVYTVQHQVGMRGAAPAAFFVEPEVAIVIDGADCSDFSDDSAIKLGKGPVISISDRSFSSDRKLVNMIIRLAHERGIPCQIEAAGSGSSDAGVIQRTGSGCETALISIPVRYARGPVTMINKEDYGNTLMLIKSVLTAIERK